MNNKLTKPQIIISITILSVALLTLLIFSKKDLENIRTKPGILLLNTDKDTYIPGEQVNLQITSLSESGTTRCDSQLELTVTHTGNTTNIPIETSPTCVVSDRVTYAPDYSAHFKPDSEGEYHLFLTNLNNNDYTESTISISNTNPEFSISRTSTNRINPFITDRYPMKLIITAKSSFSGQIIEKIPNNLEIVWQGPAKLEKFDTYQTLTWELTLKPGESKDVIYEYRAPETETQIYQIGKAIIVGKEKTFEEAKVWEIISNNE